MQLSTYIFTLALVELLWSIPLFLDPEASSKWMLRAMKEDLWMRTVGGIFVTLSFLTLKDNYTITENLTGLLRFMAWGGGIKGLILCYYPEWSAEMKGQFLKGECARIWGLGGIIVGILLILGAKTL